ncbi:MAG TPA: isoprenylcysteine carboxylmethyltransferase family protein [Rhodanobacteraceae bacterium]|nr:isoprenylcysteine carboxylmethyltransferase family protein [Rhodanobacteraceae bacterium]
MAARFAFLYGLAAYGAGLVALLYLIGFIANLFVPASIDVGRTAPWPEAVWVDLVLMGVFGAQHSVMARRSFKQWWTRFVPKSVERSTYVLATSVVLALLFWQWRPIVTPTVWHVDSPAVAQGLVGLFWLGWLLVLMSTFLINHFELFGLQQVFVRLRGTGMPAMNFKTPMLYRVVRHPLYLGLLLGFWSTPTMSPGHVLFAASASIYILVGISFEERDLVAQFGERYRRYQGEVGMLLPRPGRSWPRERSRVHAPREP